MGKPTNKVVALAILSTFVILVAGRDVAYELFLNKTPPGVSFAFWICTTAAVLSGLWVVLYGESRSLVRRLTERRVLWTCIALGIMCAVIYVTTFAVIEKVGAGLFNMIDWGLAPVLTAIIGICYDKDTVSRPRISMAIGLYVIGTIGLCSIEKQLWGPLVLIALFSPIFTAISFPVQRWLMAEKGGGLTRAQVTCVRFSPAAVTILCYQYFVGGGLPEMTSPLKLFPVAVVLGFVPLILLCYALVKTSLSRFAVWQFGIPALAFFGTLYAHPASQAFVPIASGIMVLVGILVMEWPKKDV